MDQLGWSMRLFLLFVVVIGTQEDKTCAWDGCTSLEEMTVNLGHGNETSLVYISPDVSSFYQEAPSSRETHKPQFTGVFGKFINLSPNLVRVYWDAGINQDNVYIADMAPFEASGTATFPNHIFLVTPKSDPNTVLARFKITSDQSLYTYDPLQGNVSTLSDQQLRMYSLQKENLEFAHVYRKTTGRDWLALYRKTNRPPYHMWNAEYFGQEHSVSSMETHFHSLPDDNLGPIKPRDHRNLQDYRLHSELNLTLKVLSCEPRVFEIANFMSETEADHILELATGMNLGRSTTRAGSGAEARTDDSTRTSHNTWLAREKSPVVDALYRRAADVLQMDEALLRRRLATEHPELRSKSAISEQLQLVHYTAGQQYTPHHDFSVPSVHAEGQPARFATILFYLNGGMEGGETSFPRWMNAETGEQLKVTPEKGKAVLFYSQLPDGNMDERSLHAALPVTKGEKWLTNLWVWSPYMRF